MLRRGPVIEQIVRLVDEAGAGDVFAGCPAEPWAARIDEMLAGVLRARQVGFRRFRTRTLFSPDVLRTQSGGPFAVYSPFARAAFAAGGPKPPSPSPRRIRSVQHPPASDRLDDWKLLPVGPDWAGGLRDTWIPGEAGAHARLDAFLTNRLSRYAEQRDQPAAASTSMLSPHLHFGELSAAQLWHAIATMEPGDGAEKFQRELLWREFSMHLLRHHSDLPEQPLRPAFANMAWRR